MQTPALAHALGKEPVHTQDLPGQQPRGRARGQGLHRRSALLAALFLVPWRWPSAWAKGEATLQIPAESGPSSPAQPQAHSETQPKVQLALPWSPARSPQGFWVSEKFDGVRAVWDGRVLRFRSGRPISAPAWFVAALRHVPLDGELWMGRRAFDALSGVVRQVQPDDEAWRTVKYLVFDAPGHPAPFSERLRFVHSTVQAAQLPWVHAVAHEAVKDVRALLARLRDTVSQGGEGLMLHRADALWRPGRTEALFKFKPAPDEEGLVVGHQPGKGRLTGMTGALMLQMPTGQRFALGSGLSDALRRDPPPVGAWVTYRYRDRTPSGLPRFASFLRVRDPE